MSYRGQQRTPRVNSERKGGSSMTTRSSYLQSHHSEMAMDEEPYTSTYSQSYGMTQYPHGVSQYRHGMDRHHGHQMQMEQQMMRSTQASKQMVYKVYENVIGALEEIETRESKTRKHKPLPRSKIQYADQSLRKDFDVQRQLECQLLLFQSQMTSCDSEIREPVRKELMEATLKWNGTRQRNGLNKTAVDGYTNQLLQILTEGRTQHPEVFYQSPDISESQLKENFGNFMVGEHERKKLDESFRNDPEKRAKLSEIRGSSVSEGAERVSENYPQMDTHMEDYRDSVR